ncbi:MAG: helix-turn-helix transcriptional regulator [Chloroflexi bacterium]|nr:helix-turn-helix transcriptional regulator [Chloroflexota bacterium]
MEGQTKPQASLTRQESVQGQPMLREFFLGFIKIHILHHAVRESVYGLQLIEELSRHGYHLSPGTLYPVLHELEKSGYLMREERLVDGKVRKYYCATPLGEQALEEIRPKIDELVAEVLRN